MSGRGEPAGCHGDALKGGLCARLSCAAPARIPGPGPPGSARLSPSGPARSGEQGLSRLGRSRPQGLGSSPGLSGGLGAPVQAGSVIWGARMCLALPGARLLV